jgi:hypothetical protein
MQPKVLSIAASTLAQARRRVDLPMRLSVGTLSLTM